MNFGNMGNIGQMMKQAQQIQQKMDKAKAELVDTTVSATSGGGMVEVSLNGESQIQSIKINPAVVDADDVETLEDLILSAFKSCEEKVAALREEKLGGLGGGLI